MFSENPFRGSEIGVFSVEARLEFFECN